MTLDGAGLELTGTREAAARRHARDASRSARRTCDRRRRRRRTRSTAASTTSNTAAAIRWSTSSPPGGTRLHVRSAASASRWATSVRVHVAAERVLVYPARVSAMTAAARSPPRAPFDRALLLVVPAALVHAAALHLSVPLRPACCRSSRRRAARSRTTASSSPTDNLWPTIGTTLQARAAGDAHQRRPRAADRLPDARASRATSACVTTILVVPITLGTVLIAEGMLTYFGPKGWLVAVAAARCTCTTARSASRTTTGAC